MPPSLLCAVCGHGPSDHDRQAGCLISFRNAQGVLDFCPCMAYDVGSPEAEARGAVLDGRARAFLREVSTDEPGGAFASDVLAAMRTHCTCKALRAAVRACVVLGVGAAIEGAGCAVHGTEAVTS